MARRVFILGAGFSRACAGLPLSKQMMPLILEKANADRGEQGEYVLSFYNRIAQMPLENELKGSQSAVESSNLAEDFEFILTLVDLNSDWSREFTVVGKGGNPEPTSTGRLTLAPWYYLSGCIENCIYDVILENSKPNDEVSKFVRTLNSGDDIVTFNYDLVLDQAAFEAGLWHPCDGYGLGDIHPNPRFANASPPTSAIRIFKLHGSLNWDLGGEPESEFGGEADIEMPVIIHGYHNDSREYLPGCFSPPDPLQIPQHRQSFGILPSYIKKYGQRPILSLWKQAHSRLSQAEEVVVIGYSLHPADAASQMLIATSVNDRASVIIYDVKNNLETVASRFSRALGRVVTVRGGGLEEYLRDSRAA